MTKKKIFYWLVTNFGKWKFLLVDMTLLMGGLLKITINETMSTYPLQKVDF